MVDARPAVPRSVRHRAAAVAVLIVLWSLLGRYRAVARARLTRRSAVPFAVFVLALFVAQLVDIDDQFVPQAWRQDPRGDAGARRGARARRRADPAAQ